MMTCSDLIKKRFNDVKHSINKEHKYDDKDSGKKYKILFRNEVLFINNLTEIKLGNLKDKKCCDTAGCKKNEDDKEYDVIVLEIKSNISTSDNEKITDKAKDIKKISKQLQSGYVKIRMLLADTPINNSIFAVAYEKDGYDNIIARENLTDPALKRYDNTTKSIMDAWNKNKLIVDNPLCYTFKDGIISINKIKTNALDEKEKKYEISLTNIF